MSIKSAVGASSGYEQYIKMKINFHHLYGIGPLSTFTVLPQHPFPHELYSRDLFFFHRGNLLPSCALVHV